MSLCLLALVTLSAFVTLLNRAAKLFLLFSSKVPKPQINQSTGKDQPGMQPYVAVHLAISNEDSDVVLQTLSSLNTLKYQNYIVLVVDNNTQDESLWKPVMTFCQQYPDHFLFFHLDKLSGYKAGALNYALKHTPDYVELIAIVDADNFVESDFLQDTVSYFGDEKVAIVQTPLGFRYDPTINHFMSWVFLIYRYFLSIYMPAANRFKCAPFIGAMGLIRRSALENAGGWNGFYLTEDMELTYRLLRQGYTSHFVNRAYGRSMPPADLENFKKQHYRWNFGNAQILRDYLYRAFASRIRPRQLLLRRIVYFTCPCIYINFSLFPFAFAAIAIQIAGISQIDLQFVELCGWIMLGTLAIEIAGDIIMFWVLGYYERVSWPIRLRNLVAWWGLSVNNALSSFAVLFSRTHPFHVTRKGQWNKSSVKEPRLLELAFTGLCLASVLLNLVTTFPPVKQATLSLIVIMVLSAAVFILPKHAKES